MRFRLVYHGLLPATGNSPKPNEVQRIREQFHPQLLRLWETHQALKRLRQTSIVHRDGALDLSLTDSPLARRRDFSVNPLKDWEIDLAGAIESGGRHFVPLVRKSLDLNCELNILFLRQEDPGALVFQGGDIDNRIKTLFDALKKQDDDVAARYPPSADPFYCLLESDTLISGFNVDTDRLLMPQTEHSQEVYLIIEVIIKVLSIGNWNISLVGL